MQHWRYLMRSVMAGRLMGRTADFESADLGSIPSPPASPDRPAGPGVPAAKAAAFEPGSRVVAHGLTGVVVRGNAGHAPDGTSFVLVALDVDAGETEDYRISRWHPSNLERIRA